MKVLSPSRQEHNLFTVVTTPEIDTNLPSSSLYVRIQLDTVGYSIQQDTVDLLQTIAVDIDSYRDTAGYQGYRYR